MTTRLYLERSWRRDGADSAFPWKALFKIIGDSIANDFRGRGFAAAAKVASTHMSLSLTLDVEGKSPEEVDGAWWNFHHLYFYPLLPGAYRIKTRIFRLEEPE